MSKSKVNVELLIRKAEAVLRVADANSDAPSIDELLAEIQTAMTGVTDSRESLGPLIGKLRKLQGSATMPPLNWVPVLQGHLAVDHRPKIKTIKYMRNLGATHVLTLLSEAEGAKNIGNETRRAGLNWIWLPLKSADPPSDDRRAEILSNFENVRIALDQGARIYIHCSAGIHRTGMITYALLRHLKFSTEVAITTLSELRQETADCVGDARKQWGERFA